jgi:hypothetical protein
MELSKCLSSSSTRDSLLGWTAEQVHQLPWTVPYRLHGGLLVGTAQGVRELPWVAPYRQRGDGIHKGCLVLIAELGNLVTYPGCLLEHFPLHLHLQNHPKRTPKQLGSGTILPNIKSGKKLFKVTTIHRIRTFLPVGMCKFLLSGKGFYGL